MLALMEFTQVIAKMIDAIIISRYIGTTEIAAKGIANPMFSMISILPGIMSIGVQSLCSSYLGKGDTRNAQKVFSFSLLFSLIFSAVIVAASIIWIDPLCGMLGASSGSLFEPTKAYLLGIVLGVPAMLMTPIISRILQIDGDKLLLQASVITLMVSNVIGDLAVIFFWDKSMFGIGFTTTLSNYLSCLILIAHLFRKNAMFRLRLSLCSLKDMGTVFVSGLSKGSRRICNSLRPVLLNRFIIAVTSQTVLSAYSIQNSVRDFSDLFCAGLSGTVLLIGGIFYGERDESSLSQLTKTALHSIIVVGLPIAVFIFITAPWIASIYVKDSAEIRDISVTAIRALAIALPLDALNETAINVFHFTKNYKTENFLVFCNRLFFVIPCTFLLGSLMGATGIWIAIPVAKLMITITVLAAIIIRKKGIPTSYSDLLCLADDFSYSPEDCIEANIATTEEAVALSKQVYDFCHRHHIDSRRTYLFSLCVEEMACNVIKHGFHMKASSHLMIRIMKDGDDLILRLRDDCKVFNMKSYAESLTDTPPESSIGIKLVTKAAKDIRYVYILKTNTLIITV